MKTIYVAIFSGLLSCTVIPASGQTDLDWKLVAGSTQSLGKKLSLNYFSDQSKRISFKDTFPQSGEDTLPLPHKNYLRNDDPAFNKRYSALIPIGEVVLTNGIIWSYDRYVIDSPYSHISSETIKDNFKNGWEWDTDDFPTNFSLHPYTGSLYFNAARSNGYKFYESTPFVLGGSLMWEYFMEATKPSYNDVINTTVSGIFLGEVLYRLSSSILDDRKTGGARVLREIIGTVIDPERGFNRLLQGKMTRVVQKEIYQKEPLSLTVTVGAHQPNNGSNFGTQKFKNFIPLLNLNFTYGDPYEIRYRKPFDYFRLRADLGFNSTTNVANNVIGDGFLFGGNIDSSYKMKMLIGGFQHYDYWNTDSFEIGTIGFGGSIISRVPVFRSGNFQNELHIAVVPLGASNAKKILTGTDTSLNTDFKNYTYSGGGEMKFLTALNFKWGQLAAEYYFYWLHTYVGKQSDNFISILRPRVTIKLYKSLNIGYEYLLYHRNDHYPNASSLNITTGEQRIFLLFNFVNF
ncbi:MAG TPA: DUF3943 domain-containing protein [Chitinophagales bacterium]|nr:DUF3943 domain-containing protein [Chitinophagales bacterium]